jgi:hypothetical protein
MSASRPAGLPPLKILLGFRAARFGIGMCSSPLSCPTPPGLLLSPAGLAAAYLWNPLAILSCVAGTTTPLENAAVLLALLGGALRNAPLAAAGLAAGAYIGLHPLLLAVRGVQYGGLEGGALHFCAHTRRPEQRVKSWQGQPR